ncbi:MAG: hypothetical protein EOO14_06255 [Chitinophagaceae bacterium]|nr:MAG: hypothetical protein EOO14_06255 [Chitinophagaceae bacterium]
MEALNPNQPITPHLCLAMIEKYEELLSRPNQCRLARFFRRNSLRYWQKEYEQLARSTYYLNYLN